MRDYVILTDSNADLTPELEKELNVGVFPMEFTVEEQTYFNYPDERDLSSKTFYKMLRDGKNSKTVQGNSTRFCEFFEPYLKEGKDIVYIAFSSGLSGTYHSSTMAKKELLEKYPDRQIFISDSLAASMGEGLLVYHAVQQQREGKTAEEVYQWVEENKLHLCHWFTVEDLYFLKRGGRVSAATALVGTMLGIKPVLHVDDEGHLINVSKARGRRQSLLALVENMEKTCIRQEQQVVFISKGDCGEEAHWLAGQVKQKLHVKEVKIGYIGPVIGSHSGPGTVALFFLGQKR